MEVVNLIEKLGNKDASVDDDELMTKAMVFTCLASVNVLLHYLDKEKLVSREQFDEGFEEFVSMFETGLVQHATHHEENPEFRKDVVEAVNELMALVREIKP